MALLTQDDPQCGSANLCLSHGLVIAVAGWGQIKPDDITHAA